MTSLYGRHDRRGAAAVEFFVCTAFLIMPLLYGLWEVGRMVEVQAVMVNAAREGSRQASTGEDNLATIANSVYIYLRQAEPTALPAGGVVSSSNLIASTDYPGGREQKVTLGSAAGAELFTLTFLNQTNSARNDPTTANQMDKFQVIVSLPYSNISWTSLAFQKGGAPKANQYSITNTQRVSAVVAWYSMRDTPIVISTTLPIQ